eukprot:6192403-Pleurochrysis_carterae.AAC.2
MSQEQVKTRYQQQDMMKALSSRRLRACAYDGGARLVIVSRTCDHPHAHRLHCSCGAFVCTALHPCVYYV